MRDPDRLNFPPLHVPEGLSRPEQLPGDTCPLGQGNFIELFLLLLYLLCSVFLGLPFGCWASWIGHLIFFVLFLSFLCLTVFYLFVIMY